MTTFRSEMQVPINRSEATCFLPDETPSTVSPTIDTWTDKVKHSNSASSLLQDKLASKLSSTGLDSAQFEKLRSIELFRQLHSTITAGPDDSLHFRASFDVAQVPDLDKVKVFVREGFVSLWTELRDPANGGQSEYSRRFNLPLNVVEDSLTCTVTKDAVLTIDARLREVDRRRSSGSSSHCSLSPQTLSHSHLSVWGQEEPSSPPPFPSTSPATTMPAVATSSSTAGSGYSLQVAVGAEYGPADISIKTHDRRLMIGARHEERSAARTNYREFSKQISLPPGVDPLCLSAVFRAGVLYIEAPYTD